MFRARRANASLGHCAEQSERRASNRMRISDIRSQIAIVRCETNTQTPRRYGFWSGVLLLWRRLQSRATLVFVVLSLAFGSAISVVVPPLRGPDEIAHFLRIYSYTRGELLPAAKSDGRKGIFIEHGLYAQLSFFKDAGERFARNREQGLRYGEIIKEYLNPGGPFHEEEQTAKFMPFAGTEGYSPVAYAPYVLAGAVGNLLGLDFPILLLLMRLSGVIMFTAVAAYAVKLTPSLKWAFVLIAMLPVSIYNRSVLSADGAAFALALVVTAALFQRGPAVRARLGALVVDDALLPQQAAADRLRSVGVDGPRDGNAPAVAQAGAGRGPELHLVPAMDTGSSRRDSGVASSQVRKPTHASILIRFGSSHICGSIPSTSR